MVRWVVFRRMSLSERVPTYVYGQRENARIHPNVANLGECGLQENKRQVTCTGLVVKTE